MYVYDPSAPRYTHLRTVDIGFPACDVAYTSDGTYAVVADPRTPPDLIGHALDYADRLADLIPPQNQRIHLARGIRRAAS